MARITFTENLRRHVSCPPADAAGTTVREVLDEVFLREPRLRGYVLDDQGAVRRHMAIFVDGVLIADRRNLGDRVGPAAEIVVMQALSGG